MIFGYKNTWSHLNGCLKKMELLKFVFARDYIFRFIIAFYLFPHCCINVLRSNQTRIHIRPYYLLLRFNLCTSYRLTSGVISTAFVRKKMFNH